MTGKGAPIRGELRLDAGSPAEALVLAAALQADDAAHAPCRADGRSVVVALQGTGALGILRTLDDVLDCVRATRQAGT